MFLCQSNGSFKRAGMWVTRADVQHRSNAGFARAGDYVIAIGVVFGTVYVAMRINKHRSTAG
jgi:hypothetical protein